MSPPARRMLEDISVGASLGADDDAHRRGFSDLEFQRVQVRLLEALMSHGARVVLGHDWRAGGVMYAALDSARRYADGRDPARGPICVNVLHAASASSAPEVDPARWTGVVERELLPPSGALRELIARLGPDHSAVRARALSELRVHLAEIVDARVCIGGRTTTYQGRMPGVLEEAALSVDAGVPLYVSGLLGGASAAIIAALRGDPPPPGLIPEVGLFEGIVGPEGEGGPRLHSFEEAWQMLQRAGEDKLSELNHLDRALNERLFAAQTIEEVVGIVMIGLGRIARRA